jgi:hypothetical protein
MIFDHLTRRQLLTRVGVGGLLTVAGKVLHSDYRWDIEGWYGGDYNRLWFKTEGQRDTAFKADYDVDAQLLYGGLIATYYDFQIGGRMETQSFRGRNVTRGLAVIGLEGLVPYSYQIEPTLFIDQNGAVSMRFSATKDLLFTQRLILQGRLETNLAIQRVEEFSTGSGGMKSAATSRHISDCHWIGHLERQPHSSAAKEEIHINCDLRLECVRGFSSRSVSLRHENALHNKYVLRRFSGSSGQLSIPQLKHRANTT